MDTNEIDALARLSELHKSGDLTDEEFAREKVKVIGATGGPAPRTMGESPEARAARQQRDAQIDRGRRRGLLAALIGLALLVLVSMIVQYSSKRDTSQKITRPMPASPAIPDTSKQEPTTDQPKWAYSSEHDDMRNATTYYAGLDAEDLLEFDFPYNGGSQPRLEIRKSPKFGIDVMLAVSKGQFNPNYYNPTIAVKFDDGKVQKFSVSEPSDGTTGLLFVGGASRFIEAMSHAKRTVIEAPFYQEGVRQMEFKTAGFSKKEWLAQ